MWFILASWGNPFNPLILFTQILVVCAGLFSNSFPNIVSWLNMDGDLEVCTLLACVLIELIGARHWPRFPSSAQRLFVLVSFECVTQL